MFNTLSRQQVATRSSYFIRRLLSENITLEDVQAAVKNPNADVSRALLDQITRFKDSLRDTQPFWSRKLHKTQSMIAQLRYPSLFVTFSATNLQ